ncbi:MAG TPA: dTDP-4-dehydrorhamnose reductase [Allosphingosinicella sp.]|jgi:dTDP-4-dehydrorhamnose reductase
MTRPRLLVTGGSGQVGTALAERSAGGPELLLPPRAEFDLVSEESMDSWFSRHRVDAVINAAAYTAVDRAEEQSAEAWAVNADGPGALAARCARLGVPMIHLSTDYVFDGSKPGFYAEDDPVAPINAYGASKEAGERAVRASGARHLILRTAWVMSPWGSNFARTMIRLGAERPELRIVDDQLGSPTGAIDIADAAMRLAARLAEDADAPAGTYHFVNSGQASWYDVASAIFEAAARHGRPAPALIPIASSEYPTPARRPANSRLDSGKLRRDYGIDPRPWREAVDEIVGRILAAPVG